MSDYQKAFTLGSDPFAMGLPSFSKSDAYQFFQTLPSLNGMTGQIASPNVGEQSGGTFAMFDFFKKITSGQFWQQFGIVVIGIVVLLGALYMFASGNFNRIAEKIAK